MPLAPPHKVQYYRRFPALLRSDEAYMGLDALGHGILTGILDHQSVNGSVPSDPEILAGIVGATPEQVRHFLGTFKKLMTLEALEGGPPDRLANPFLHRELNAIHSIIEDRRKAGAKGGRKTQARARSLQVQLEEHSSCNIANLEHSSSRQEQETDKAKIQKNKSRQQHDRSVTVGHQQSNNAADAIVDLPEDIQERLACLGIAANLWPDLCARTGGPRELRAALELLDAKLQQKEIHSPSGFFLRCAEELAQEGVTQYERAQEEAMRTNRKALTDSQWVQLPKTCRESLEVLRAWCAWWDLQERVSSASNAIKDDLTLEAWNARATFLEICLQHHPQRSEFIATIADSLNANGNTSESPYLAKRIRIGLLGNLIGLAQ